MKALYQVDIHYACFGIEALNGVVTEAAPIAKWMVGKSLQAIKLWLISKKAKVVQV